MQKSDNKVPDIEPRFQLYYVKKYLEEYDEMPERLSELLNIPQRQVENYYGYLTSSKFYEGLKRQVKQHSHLNIGDTMHLLGAPLLYVLVRYAKPNHMVETGVSSGFSTAVILKALKDNGKGILHSIDLPNADPAGCRIPAGKEVGWAVPEELRENWHLILGNARDKLPLLLQELGQIDMFYHDSLHTYEHMYWEYVQAWNSLRIGGILASDDANWHLAFADFTERYVRHPTEWKHYGLFYSTGIARKIVA